MFLDIITSALGLIVPPAFDFIKKKFIKGKDDSPKATISSLAVTKPEVLPEYIKAYSTLVDAFIREYNKDVIAGQQLSTWVCDLRASIRPVFTVISIGLMFAATMMQLNIDPSIKSLMELTISSWFGSRLI